MSRSKECPKCEADVSDSYEPDDPSVGITGGWYCDVCDLGIGEDDYEPMEGDIQISGSELTRPIGTPISELSAQPGPANDPFHPDHARYAEFVRIARSWGYD